jgi:hypothetical protein
LLFEKYRLLLWISNICRVGIKDHEECKETSKESK